MAFNAGSNPNLHDDEKMFNDLFNTPGDEDVNQNQEEVKDKPDFKSKVLNDQSDSDSDLFEDKSSEGEHSSDMEVFKDYNSDDYIAHKEYVLSSKEKEDDLPMSKEETKIPGLFIYRNLMNEIEQRMLIKHILKENIFPELTYNINEFDITLTSGLDFSEVKTNQAMRFGQLNKNLLNLIQNKVYDPTLNFPNIIKSRNPLFDQAIYNLYEPGQGILPHIDLAKFKDGIIGISLLSSITMNFFPAKENQLISGYSQIIESNEIHSFRLNPGDVYVLTDEARYYWCHTIPEVLFDELPDGSKEDRKYRISITLRKMCQNNS